MSKNISSKKTDYKKISERLYKQLQLYDDYESHHNDWVEACKIAEMSCTEEDGKSYWKHQLKTLKGIRDSFNKNRIDLLNVFEGMK